MRQTACLSLVDLFLLRGLLLEKILYTLCCSVLYGTVTNDTGLFSAQGRFGLIFVFKLLHSFNSDNIITRIIFAYLIPPTIGSY